ncbi:TRAP transporter substrate-binding protein [Paracoccus sp. (in: a-proteobacteria)]|uniref:TRAP transporter substrate-binding protein n=1 Tax=Paracoccus sp. TaxID=267 RepID=UPI003A8B46A3
MKLDRFFAAAAMARGAVVTPASAEELIAALVGPLETAQGQGLQRFGERLSELTGGDMTVKIFPDGQLGSNSELFEQVANGQIDIFPAVPSIIAEFVPEIQVMSVPFLFRDFDHWQTVIDGDIGKELADMTAARSDVMVVGYFGGSVRNLVARPDVPDPTDLGGMKMRLHASPLLVESWKAIGANPTVVAYNEIYNALQLNVLDALENEPEWVLRMKFYEQASHYVLTEHEIVTRPLVFSRMRFEGFTPEQQDAVLQAAREAADFQQQLEHRLDAESRQELADKHGMTLIEVDKQAIVAKVAPAAAAVIDDLGLTAMVEKIRAE